jgi:hypothetical protein
MFSLMVSKDFEAATVPEEPVSVATSTTRRAFCKLRSDDLPEGLWI